MKKVTVHRAKTDLSRLLRKVALGGEVALLRGREPVALLVLPEGGAETPFRRV